MQHNNKNNLIIAEKLNAISQDIKALDSSKIRKSAPEIHKAFLDIELIAKEYNLHTLLAVVHCIDFSTEIDNENSETIEALLEDGHFYKWIDAFVNILNKYEDGQRAEIHRALTLPKWVVKPSNILLKDVAFWIADIKNFSDSGALYQEVDMEVTDEESFMVADETYETIPGDSLNNDELFSENNALVNSLLSSESDTEEDSNDEGANQEIVNEVVNDETISDLLDTDIIENPKAESSFDFTNDKEVVPENTSTEEDNVIDVFSRNSALISSLLAKSTNTDSLNENDDLNELDSDFIEEDKISNEETNHIDSAITEKNESVSDNVDVDVDVETLNTKDNEYNIPLLDSSSDLESIENNDLKTIDLDNEASDDVESDDSDYIHNSFIVDETTNETENDSVSKIIETDDVDASLNELQLNDEETSIDATNVEFSPEISESISSVENNSLSEKTLGSEESHDLISNSIESHEEDSLKQEATEASLEHIDDEIISEERSTSTNESELIDTTNDDLISSSGLKMTWNDDIHPELLMVYLEETPAQVNEILPLLSKINKGKSNKDERYTSARLAHTIKGASAVVGITALADLASHLETVLDFSVDSKLDEEFLNKIPEVADCIETTFENVQLQQDEPENFPHIFSVLEEYASNIENNIAEKEEYSTDTTEVLVDDLYEEESITDTLAAGDADISNSKETEISTELKESIADDAVDLDKTETKKSDFKLTWDDDTHPELLMVYLEETPTQISELIPLLHKISKNQADAEEKHTASRMAHTIKGGSAIVGITALSEMSYRLETLLDHSVNNDLPQDILDTLPKTAICLDDLFEAIQMQDEEPAEYFSLFTKLDSYVDSINDIDDTPLELPTLDLPDFILNQNSSSTEVEETETLESEDALIENTIENETNTLDTENLTEVEDTTVLEVDEQENNDFIEDNLSVDTAVSETENTNDQAAESNNIDSELIDSPEILDTNKNLIEDSVEAVEATKSNNDLKEVNNLPAEKNTIEIDSKYLETQIFSFDSEIGSLETENTSREEKATTLDVSSQEVGKLIDDVVSDELAIDDTESLVATVDESTDIETEAETSESTDSVEDSKEADTSYVAETLSAGVIATALHSVNNSPEEEVFKSEEIVQEPTTETQDPIKLDKLKSKDDVNNIVTELNDIVLNLIDHSNLCDDPSNYAEQCSVELDRFELITEISGYPELSLLGEWCKLNLKTYSKTQSEEFKSFIQSNETWSWIEHTSEALRDSEDMSHMSSLSVELMREEWLEAIQMEDLQTVLLALRHLEDSSSAESSEYVTESENDNEVISWDQDVHPELLAVYFQETPDQIDRVAGLLHKISRGESTTQENKEAARIAHTIKGSSGVVGINSLLELTHHLEDVLDYSVNNTISEETADLLSEASDCLESLFETIQDKKAPPEELNSVVARLATYTEEIGQIDSSSSESNNYDDENSSLVDMSTVATNVVTNPTSENSSAPQVDLNEAYIRVPIKVIDKLLNLAGELVTTSSQVSDNLAKTQETNKTIRIQDERVHSMLLQLNNTITQQEKDQQTLISSINNSDFDSLEMDTYNELQSVASLLSESILDSQDIDNTLSKQLEDLSEKLHSLEKLNKSFSDVILSSRMVTIDTIVPRLERIVRQTCRKTNKKAQLKVTGNNINIDTDILNNLVDPLLHMLRNSIDHGIEMPEIRKSKGKDETGLIELSFSRDGNHIVMSLKDDGAGIDPEKIYQKAIEKELITPDQEFSDYEAIKLILQPGFTTQEKVTDISGRGVGMDVVNTSINDLNGTMDIDSKLEKGTTFNLSIPLTLITNTVLLVKVENNTLAIPTDIIEQIVYLEANTLSQRENNFYVTHADEELEAQPLGRLLTWPHQPINAAKSYNVLIIKTNNKTHAIHIDSIVSSREVVVKPLSPWISPDKGVIGACHLTDGGVAPVINLKTVVSRSVNNDLNISLNTTLKPEVKKQILVVDDSLSNRKALSLIIEKTDYDVLTAVDGLDALQIMNKNNIDLVFTDLEMPRMNGLELTQSIRAWNDKKETPIVMITSRTTTKHRDLAKKAGVDDYLTKPVETEILLNAINTWLTSKEKHDAGLEVSS